MLSSRAWQTEGVKLTCKEEDDDDRVYNREPVNVEIGHLEIDVPPRRPPHLTPTKINLITEHHVGRTCPTSTDITFQ